MTRIELFIQDISEEKREDALSCLSDSLPGIHSSSAFVPGLLEVCFEIDCSPDRPTGFTRRCAKTAAGCPGVRSARLYYLTVPLEDSREARIEKQSVQHVQPVDP